MTYEPPTIPSDLTTLARVTPYLKDILVHVDGSDEDDIRLAHAELLAKLAGAKLIGMFTIELPEVAFYFVDSGPPVGADLLANIQRSGQMAYEKLRETFARLAVPNELQQVAEIPSFLYKKVASQARCADLFIASCPYGANDSRRSDRMVETVMFEGAHGVYLVPRGVRPTQAIRKVLIGWNDTREAARAVDEAMPIMNSANAVQLTCVRNAETPAVEGAESLLDVASHLTRHGLETSIQMLQDAASVSVALLGEAHRISADMIVIGAYGHSRLREWLLGGTTYDLIRTSNLPLLVAN